MSKNYIEMLESELAAANMRIASLEEQVTKDELTGLGNRRGLNMYLPKALSNADRSSANLAVIAIDIDHFKRVNDVHGHSAGDAVLQRVARVIQSVIRTGDCAFRQGGEEMTVIATTTHEGATTLAEKLRAAVECIHDVNEIPVTISLGVTMAKGDDSEETLMERADKALYEAKDNGRNRVELA